MRGAQVLSVVLALSATGSASGALTPDQVDAGAHKAGKGLKPLVRQLASNRLAGRDNGSRGSALAQALLRKRLARIGEGLGPDPDHPYEQPFERQGSVGINLVARIPGRELPAEVVVLGAHYDHLAEGTCLPEAEDPDDVICNGAADNATGAAVVLAVGKAIHKLPEPPRRSVVLALWDAEEDGLRGSAHYVAEPLVPLDETVTYVNLDVLGTAQLPSLRRNTLVLASETGGGQLHSAVLAAVNAQALTASFLSYALGQGRSDYESFGAASVPTVYFSDGPYPCYHTAGDEVRRIDFAKLEEQSAIVFRTVVGLAEGEEAPPFLTPKAAASYDDAVALHEILDRSVPADLALYPPDLRTEIVDIAASLEATVADGPAAFDLEDAVTVLLQAATLGESIPALGCPAF